MTTLDEVRRWETKPLPRPRWVAHLRAFRGGYFWLPCGVCGRYFGGQEWRIDGDFFDSYATGPGTGKGFCPGHIRPVSPLPPKAGKSITPSSR